MSHRGRKRNNKGQFFGKSSYIPHPDERFNKKFVVDPSGCHVWIAGKSMGYGQFWADGKKVRAHVYAYERKYGPVPKGKVLDHFVCDRRDCVNAEHLHPVTVTENVQRSPLHGINKTNCPRGHEYSVSNTYIGKSGTRYCRTCHREKERGRKEHARMRQEVA